MPAHFPLQARAAATTSSKTLNLDQSLAEQRVSGARIAYSLQQLQADAAGDAGSVWCDGAGASSEAGTPLGPRPPARVSDASRRWCAAWMSRHCCRAGMTDRHKSLCTQHNCLSIKPMHVSEESVNERYITFPNHIA